MSAYVSRKRDATRSLCIATLVIFFSLSQSVANGQDVHAPVTPLPPVDEDNPQVWKEFTSTGGRFTVLLPGAPVEQSSPTFTTTGKIDVYNFTARTNRGAYLVAYANLSAAPDGPVAVRKALNGGRNQVLIGGAQLIWESETTLEGLPARELIIEKSGAVFRVLIFLERARLYQLIVGTVPSLAFRDGKSSANPDDRTESFERNSRRFFESFRLMRNNAVK